MHVYFMFRGTQILAKFNVIRLRRTCTRAAMRLLPDYIRRYFKLGIEAFSYRGKLSRDIGND